MKLFTVKNIFKTNLEWLTVLAAVLTGPVIGWLALLNFKIAVAFTGGIVVFLLTYFHVRIALILLTIYMPFMHVLPNINIVTGVNLFNIMTITMVMAWAVNAVRENQPMTVPLSVTRPVLSLILFASFSLIIGFLNSGYFGYLGDKIPEMWQWLGVMIFPFILTSIIKDRKEIIIFLTLIALIVIVAAVDAIHEHHIVTMGISGFSHDLRIGGIFGIGGENDLGALFGEFILISIFLLFAIKSRLIRLLLLIGLGSTFLALLYTYSRGAWMGTAAGITIFVLLHNKKLLPALAIIIILVIFASPESVRERVNMIKSEDNGQLESSASSRIEFWKAGVRMLRDNPLTGVGFRRFSVELPNYMNVGEFDARTPHNQFVSIFSEMGLPAFFVFLWLFWELGKTGWILYRTGHDKFSRMLGALYLGFLADVIVINMFGVRFIRAELTGIFWVFTGLVIKVKIMSEQSNTQVKELIIE